MKKSSRRNNAKNTTAARTARPRASSKKSHPSIQVMYHHQDTPPDVQILDGSLLVESTRKFTETSGARHLYRLTTNPWIKHIRVMSDSGEKLYEDLYASDGINSSRIEIVWMDEDRGTGNVIVTSGAVFQIDSDKKLGAPGPGLKKRRRYRYKHPGRAADKEIRIESIEITNALGRKTRFTATPINPGEDFAPDEFRILIWR